MIRAVDSASTFELARYAEAQICPLVDQLPGGAVQIELNLGMPYFAKHSMDWSITIQVRENSSIGNQGEWVLHTGLIDTSKEVERAVLEVHQHLSTLKAAA